MDNPVLVEVTRGDLVESRHRGAAALVDAAGRVVMAWGDIERPIYARSALKPLQALPLVESGAADHFALGQRELALACASHHGEAPHVAVVSAWLARIGCSAADLECGSHPPLDAAAAASLIRRGEAPSALHSNCSGKHSGFLTTARFLGEATGGYVAPDHPAQRRILAALEAMTGLDLSRAARGTDGCGIPVIAIPLSGLARAMARMVDPKGVAAERAAAARRLLEAMAAEPLMVSGSTGFATALLAAAGGERAREAWRRRRLRGGAAAAWGWDWRSRSTTARDAPAKSRWRRSWRASAASTTRRGRGSARGRSRPSAPSRAPPSARFGRLRRCSPDPAQASRQGRAAGL